MTGSCYNIINCPINRWLEIQAGPLPKTACRCAQSSPNPDRTDEPARSFQPPSSQQTFLKCLPFHPLCQGLLDPRSYHNLVEEPQGSPHPRSPPSVPNLQGFASFPEAAGTLLLQVQKSMTSLPGGQTLLHNVFCPRLRAGGVASVSERARQLLMSTGVLQQGSPLGSADLLGHWDAHWDAARVRK